MKLNLDFQMDFPEDWIPIDAVTVVKMLDNDGNPALAIRTTAGLMPWEAAGMLLGGADAARGALQDMFHQGKEE